MKKITGRAKGGVARAESLTPEERKRIARKAATTRWGNRDDKAEIKPVQQGKTKIGITRDEIALRVLQGLYSNVADAQRFAAFAMGDAMPVDESFVRVAYEQADTLIRLRSL